MPSREEKKAATRKRLLDAAAGLIARHGAHATSLDAIAEAAGLTKGAVYSNFADKAELLTELMDRGPTVEREIDASQPIADQLETIGAEIAEALRSVSRRSWHLTLELYYLAMRDARFRRTYARETRENRAVVGAQLEQVAAARGEPLPLPGPQLALVMNALAVGLAQQRTIDPASVPDDLFPKAYRLLAG